MRAKDAEGLRAAIEEANGERSYGKPVDVEKCECELKKNERGKNFLPWMLHAKQRQLSRGPRTRKERVTLRGYEI